MKNKFWPILSTLILLVGAMASHAYTINDNYIGADPTHNWAHTDVIGDPSYYDIRGMNVKTAGSSMTVNIFTSFVTKTSTATIWNDQTHIGDLFIGTGGWDPYGTAPYKNDSASNSDTKWDYVVVLTPRIPTVSGDKTRSGAARVYSTKDGSFVKSNIGTLNPNQWVYRADQYVQFTPNAGADALDVGTWAILNDDLQIKFDYSDIIAAGNDWAFHWAMTCGNDVIEGETSVPPVPEPSTLLLLGGALLGLGIFARRRMR